MALASEWACVRFEAKAHHFVAEIVWRAAAVQDEDGVLLFVVGGVQGAVSALSYLVPMPFLYWILTYMGTML